MRFYELTSPMFWGDYTSDFTWGLCPYPFREGGSLLLYRVGPFTPPIAITTIVYVTDYFRHRLEARFPDISYRAIKCQKVVRCEWQDWTRSELPAIAYQFHEPGTLLEEGEHDDVAASGLGPLWELVPPAGGMASFFEMNGRMRLRIDSDSWTGQHIFKVCPAGTDLVVVSDVGREWLLAQAPEWVDFEPCDQK